MERHMLIIKHSRVPFQSKCPLIPWLRFVCFSKPSAALSRLWNVFRHQQKKILMDKNDVCQTQFSIVWVTCYSMKLPVLNQLCKFMHIWIINWTSPLTNMNWGLIHCGQVTEELCFVLALPQGCLTLKELEHLWCLNFIIWKWRMLYSKVPSNTKICYFYKFCCQTESPPLNYSGMVNWIEDRSFFALSKCIYFLIPLYLSYYQILFKVLLFFIIVSIYFTHLPRTVTKVLQM